MRCRNDYRDISLNIFDIVVSAHKSVIEYVLFDVVRKELVAGEHGESGAGLRVKGSQVFVFDGDSNFATNGVAVAKNFVEMLDLLIWF